MSYASGTTGSADKSRAEIERTLQRFGADQFTYGWSHDMAMIQFRAAGKVIRFLLEMPDQNDDRFWFTPARKTKRSPVQAHAEWEKETRRSWRSLAAVIKAKLVAVDDGITTFESEFLAHIVLPDGSTVGQWALPQVEETYETGEMPAVLPALGAGS